MLRLGALEENVLTALCWSESAAALSMRLTRESFSTLPYKRIAEAALTFVGRYHKPPRGHIRDLLEERLNRGEDGRLMSDAIRNMERLAPELNVEYVMDSLDEFLQLRAVRKAIDEGAEAADRGDLAKAWNALLKGRAPVRTSTGLWLADTERSLRFMEQREEDYFATGVQALDDFGIRPQRRTMLLLIAASGLGKSWFLIECGKQGILHHKKVYHATLEMDEDQTSQRYVQALLAMTADEVETFELPYFDVDDRGRILGHDYKSITAEPAILENRQMVVDKLRMLERRAPVRIEAFPSGTLTVGQLEMRLDTLEQESDFVPDLILVDYPDLMEQDSGDIRISLGRTYVNLRGVAQKRNAAMVVVTQGNRGSSRAKTVRADMVAEDWSKVATADKILTYSQTEEELRANLARLFVEKGRTKRDKWTCFITQNYATGQFCIDSARPFGKRDLEVLQGISKDADQ